METTKKIFLSAALIALVALCVFALAPQSDAVSNETEFDTAWDGIADEAVTTTDGKLQYKFVKENNDYRIYVRSSDGKLKAEEFQTVIFNMNQYAECSVVWTNAEDKAQCPIVMYSYGNISILPGNLHYEEYGTMYLVGQEWRISDNFGSTDGYNALMFGQGGLVLDCKIVYLNADVKQGTLPIRAYVDSTTSFTISRDIKKVDMVMFGTGAKFDSYGYNAGIHIDRDVKLTKLGLSYDLYMAMKTSNLSQFRVAYIVSETESFMDVGNGQFVYCGDRNARSVTVPENVKVLAKGAFNGCVSIENITFESALTTIGDDAFNGCTALRSIVIPDTVTSIGNYAFKNCISLQSISFPASLETLGMDVLAIDNRYDGSLTSVTFKNGTAPLVIGYGFMRNQGALESIVLPANVSKIQGGAFLMCESLETVSFLEGEYKLESIDSNVFENTSMISLGLPAAKLSDFGFLSAIPDAEITYLNENTNLSEIDGILYFKDTSGGLSTVKASKSVSGEVVFPDGLVTIGDGLFLNGKVTKVTIPASVTYIGYNAFRSCPLESLVFEDGSQLEFIGEQAFYECELTELVLPASLTELGSAAFAVNAALKSVVFNSSELLLGDYLFMKCTSLSDVTFGNADIALAIGSFAFNTTALKSFDVPKNTMALGVHPFGETDVSELHIPAAVQEMALDQDMSGSIVTPFSKNITKVIVDPLNPVYMEKDGTIYMKADGALMIMCILDYVKDYVMPDEVVFAQGAFINHANLQNVTFNAAIAEADYGYLSGYTFFGCTSLKTVDLSKTTYGEIEGMAFSNSSVEKVILPASVYYIYSQAFENCKNLTDVDFSRCTQPMAIDAGAFNGCESLEVLNLPNTLNPMDSGVFVMQIIYGCENLKKITFLDIAEPSCYSTNADGTVVYCDLDGMKFIDCILPGAYKSTPEHGNVFEMPAEVNVLLIPDVLAGADWITVSADNPAFAAVDGVLYDKGMTTLFCIPRSVTAVNAPATLTTVGGDPYGMGIDINPFANAVSLKEFKLVGSSQNITFGFIDKNPGLETIVLQTTGSVEMYSGFGVLCPNVIRADLDVGSLEGSVCNGSAGYDLNLKVASESDFTIDGSVREFNLTCPDTIDVNSLFREQQDFGKLRFTLNGEAVDVIPCVFGHSITVTSDIPGFQVFADQIYNDYRGGFVVYSFATDDALTNYDITVTGAELTAAGIKVVMDRSDVTVIVSEKVSENSVTVTFDVNGGSIPADLATLAVGEGRTIPVSEISARAAAVSRDGYAFGGWFVNELLTSVYDFSPVDADTVLIAKWIADDGFTVTLDDMFGPFEVLREDGSLLASGDRVANGEVLTLRAGDGQGVDFFGWNIVANGISTFAATDPGDYEVEITDHTCIYPQVRTYATSNIIINKTEMPSTIGTDLQTLWVKQYPVQGNAMAPRGQPSVPLIVDDRIYIRAADDLTMLDLRTGELLKALTDKGTTSVDIFHYLGYGNGVIIDFNTSKAYDTDLVFMYDLPVSVNATFYDEAGYFIGLSKDGLVRFDASTGELYKEGAWAAPIEHGWHNLYGTTSAPVIVGDWMYYPAVCGASGDGRAIEGVNIISGEKTQFVIDRITEEYYDDGWLTGYQHEGKDYLFLTCYNKGQFGSQIGDVLRGTVNCVQLNDDGTINQDFERWMYVKDPLALSAMVVVDGRGYLYANGLYVLDIDKFLDAPQSIWEGSDDFRLGYGIYGRETDPDRFIIYKEDGPKKVHGSIVTSTYYKDTTGKVYIYVLPYDGAQTVYTFCDWEGKTEPSGVMKGEEIQYDYGTQAVRIGPNGEMVWYTDTGALYCMKPVQVTQYDFLLHNGSKLVQVSVYGSTVGDALMSALRFAYPGADIDGLLVDGAMPSVFVKDGDSWAAKDPTSVALYGYRMYLVSLELDAGADGTVDLETIDGLYYSDVMGQKRGMTLSQALSYPFMDLVFVKNVRPVTDIDLGPDFIAEVGDSGVIVPEIAPGNAIVSGVIWSVDDSDVAVIDQNGSITFLKAGTVIITATAVDGSGVTGTCTATVRDAAFGIEIDSDSVSVEKDKTVQLQASMMPADAAGYVLIWDSSDDAVATVDQNGKVTGLKAGTATISVAAEGTDLIAYCMVSVTDTVSETDTSKDDEGNTTETTTDRIDAGNGTVVEKVTEKVTGSDGKVQSEKVTMTVKTQGSDVQTQVVLSTAGGASSANVVTELPVSTVPGKVPVADVSSEALGIAMKQILAAQNSAGDSAVRSTVTVKVSVGDADGLKVRMPASAVQALSEAAGSDVSIESDRGTILLSGDVMDSLSFAANDSIEFSMNKKGASGLTDAQKALVEDASVYQLNAAADATAVHQLGGTATVSVPFQVADGKSLSDLIVYHIEDDGTLSKVFFVYDRDTEMLSFMTTHFSDFVVGYDATVPEVVIDNGSFEQTITVCIAIIMGLVIVIGVLGMMFYTRTKTQ